MENKEEDRLIKELLANYKTPEDLIGENGLLKRLTNWWREPWEPR